MRSINTPSQFIIVTHYPTNPITHNTISHSPYTPPIHAINTPTPGTVKKGLDKNIARSLGRQRTIPNGNTLPNTTPSYHTLPHTTPFFL